MGGVVRSRGVRAAGQLQPTALVQARLQPRVRAPAKPLHKASVLFSAEEAKKQK